jgi:hypothetical protein
MHDGKAYTYKGARSIDAWTTFWTGEYIKAESRDIPRPTPKEGTEL